MSLFRVDTLIKELRKTKGFTQDQLCEGICAKDSLSRIERGLRRPDWYTFELLMQRLGEDPRKYYSDIITMSEMRVINIKHRLSTLMRDDSESGKSEAEQLILELKQDKDFQKGRGKQFLLMTDAAISHQNENYERMYYFATKAMKISRPHFDEDKINTYILTNDEVMLINQIAIAQCQLASFEQGTQIFLKLKESLDNNYINDEEKQKKYIGLLYNISKNLGMLKEYEQCIPICDSGIELCKRQFNAYHYPLFLFNKACCILALGKTEESISLLLLEKAYTLLVFYGRFTEKSFIENYVKDEFGVAAANFRSNDHEEDQMQLPGRAPA